MIMNIELNGLNSDDYHLVVEHFPSYPMPKRSFNIYSILGRNGDIYQDNGSWENYSDEYQLSLVLGGVDYSTAIRSASKFLSQKGYIRLVDSNDPLVYRMVYIKDGVTITNILNATGKAKMKIDCKPFRYYFSGETAVTIASGGTLTNPSDVEAYPLIKVTGKGAGTLTIGAVVMTFKALDDYLMIDCAEQNIYRQLSENRNSYVELGLFPTLLEGINTVSFSGGITGCEITPRWVTV